MKYLLAPLVLLLSGISAFADSKVWTFRSNFIYDPWNRPILPYLATIPHGMGVSAENIRAHITPGDFVTLKTAATTSESKRLVKRQLVTHLRTASDVQNARSYLLPARQSVSVDVFQLLNGYIDRFGLVAILQLVAKWQCSADEHCPEKTAGNLETLLARDGKIMKTEAYFEARGKPWILATITYEVPLGKELKVIPLRSRLLEIQETATDKLLKRQP